MAKRNLQQSSLKSDNQQRYRYTYLEHQKPAVNAIVDLFRGIPFDKNQLPMRNPEAKYLAGYEPTIMRSIRDIQQRNHIYPFTQSMSFALPEFDIEMETGTGKTYVYLRTAYELNKAYGLCKFIVVVPSRAIFSGVADNMQYGGDLDVHLSKEEFRDINGAKYCIYESGNTAQITSFVNSSGFAILLITLDAFNRDSNILNRHGNESSPDGRPLIELIAETNPIIILDEPQKKSGGVASREALLKLKPMCILNYSATHRVKHTLLYRLDPVKSFQDKLVKGLTVTGFGENDKDDVQYKFASYLHVTKCEIKSGKVSVKFKYLDLNGNQSDIKELTYPPKAKSDSLKIDFFAGQCDLAAISNNPGYAGWYFDPQGIVAEDGDRHITLNGRYFYLGEVYGDENFDDDGLRKKQIEITVKSHLEREQELIIERGKEGLSRYKVLSLFFIDRVDKYATGKTDRNGEYAEWFREIYKREIKNYPEVEAYWAQYANDIDSFHNGYFAQKTDKGKQTDEYVDTKDNWEDSDKKAAQIAAVDAIINDRKLLRNITYPLRFIFSHSALQEGWDNPNVFQICTLAVNRTEVSKRQRIGRGMRLPVDEFENRNCPESDGAICPNGSTFIYQENLNRLHVIANQSFKSFAKNLQKDYEAAGIVFGECSPDAISALPITNEVTGEQVIIDHEFACEIMDTWKNQGLLESKTITRDGNKVEVTLFTDTFRKLIAETPDDIPLPQLPANISDDTRDRIRKALIQYCEDVSIRQLPVKNEKKTLPNERLDKNNPAKRQMFEAIYDRIKYQTGYRFSFKTPEYIDNCVKRIEAIKDNLQNRTIVIGTGGIKITRDGVDADNPEVTPTPLESASKPEELPDVVDSLVEALDDILVTRRTIIEIINQSHSLECYYLMPQYYIKKVSEILKDVRTGLIMKGGIQYFPNGKTIDKRIFDCHLGKESKDQDNGGKLMDTVEDENGNPRYHDINGNPRETKSLYRFITFDSKRNEQKVQEWLECDTSVKMYAKLPDAFKIETPFGSYNPDWAIVREENGEEQVYFVFESKTASADQIRRNEGLLGDHAKDKIDCAAMHFKCINDNYFKAGDRIRFFAGNQNNLKSPTWGDLSK